MIFRFAYPILLAVLLALIAGWILLRVKRKPPALTFSVASSLIGIYGPGGKVKARIPLMLKTAAFVLLALAAGRPQLYSVSHEIQSPGVDIIMCIDTSGTMQALDFTLDGKPVSRLTAVKKVVSDFIPKRENDRIGLVVFGDAAYTQAPLTMDKGLLLKLVDGMQIGMAGESTAIGDAIAVSSKRLKDLKAPSKILILLTDGRHNAGQLTPQQAAEAAAALGIKIYTIGVGGSGEAPFPVNTIFGQRIAYQAVDLDEDTLKQIASETGGRYFLASDTKSLEEIYGIIDKAEKREVKLKEFFNFKELYRYLLIPAIALMLLGFGLETTALRVVP
jgi:Ca-activated chloride channel family protein